MKLHKKHANIERGGVQAESTFTIKTTAKSFEILSSGLYTDPITAIIRELSCNAHDAHIAANKADLPFNIHLPNNLEPFFSVTDYGIGLSDDQIQGELVPIMAETAEGNIVNVLNDDGEPTYRRSGGLYTTYFDSTKTDSNDYIGALGLGSKSPFSYVDAFDVTSCYDGTKYMYSIFLNEDGIPSVALLGQTPTEDSNGLEVKIAVTEDDFHTFNTKTASILRYFPVPPNVTGVTGFEFVQLPDKRLSGDGWFVANKNWNTESFTAVQGNVPYRVNLSQITDDLTEEELQFLNKATIITFFDIGELDVAANREEIRYDKRTKAALVSKMRQIRNDLTIEIEDQANKYQDSFWDACIELDNLSNTLFGAVGSIRIFAKQDNTTNPTLRQYIESKGVVDFKSMRQHDLVRYTATTTGKTSRKHTTRNRVVGTIEPTNKTVIFFNDVRVGGIGRVKEFLHNSNTHKDAIVINRFKQPIDNFTTILDDKTKIVSPALPVPNFDVEDELKNLLDDIGNPPMLMVSADTITKPHVQRKNIPIFRYKGTREINQSYYGSTRVVWEKLGINDIDLDNGGIYFLLKHSTQITSNNQHINWQADEVQLNFERMVKAINDANGTNFEHKNLYGVSAAALKQIKKEDDWVDVFELFRKTLTNYTSDIQHHCNVNATPDVYGIKQFITRDDFTQHLQGLDIDSPFRQHIEPMVNSVRKHGDSSTFVQFITDFIRQFDAQLQQPDGEGFFNYKDFHDYPMLLIIGSLTNCQGNWQILFDYIKQTDRS